jgi:predicted DCC family thiol-disulfide oxidoreductase YuxK
MPPPILLYDGVCGLCNRLVQFILRRDRAAVFRFAALQTRLGARILTRHGANPTDLDTVYIVVNHDLADERLLSRSAAILFVLQQIDGFWRAPAYLLRRIPRPLRDWAYRLVAHNRYRIFGRFDTCPLPSEATRSRFLDR